MDFVTVCKPAWWGTSNRTTDTAAHMTATCAHDLVASSSCTRCERRCRVASV